MTGQDEKPALEPQRQQTMARLFQFVGALDVVLGLGLLFGGPLLGILPPEDNWIWWVMGGSIALGGIGIWAWGRRLAAKARDAADSGPVQRQ